MSTYNLGIWIGVTQRWVEHLGKNPTKKSTAYKNKPAADRELNYPRENYNNTWRFTAYGGQSVLKGESPNGSTHKEQTIQCRGRKQIGVPAIQSLSTAPGNQNQYEKNSDTDNVV